MALGVVAFGIVVIFGKEAFAMKGAARRKMIVAFILMLEAIIFFVLYSQMPTSLNSLRFVTLSTPFWVWP